MKNSEESIVIWRFISERVLVKYDFWNKKFLFNQNFKVMLHEVKK